jgi:hypothetical protein
LENKKGRSSHIASEDKHYDNLHRLVLEAVKGLRPMWKYQLKRKMLILFLWIALFLDVLESFSPPVRVGVTSTSLKNAASLSEDATVTDVTLIVPPAIASEEGYPSSLHKIHIRTLMSEDEASTCCKMAMEYAASTGRWDAPDFDRHQSYATCDFPIDDYEPLQDYLEEIGFDGRLWEQLSELYKIEEDDMSYLDLFVAHYQSKNSEESNVMDRLELHRDGSILSFSLLLNSPDDFTGGGTLYDALRDVEPSGILHSGGVIRPERAGDACLHSGKLLHGADVVTSGSRTVLVGFVEVSERCIRPGVLAQACTDFGRMDVGAYRFKRQSHKHHRGWVLNNGRWLQGHSHLKGYVPAFESVIRRAEPEYQRKRKLEAEDILLRQILLPEEERTNEFMGGDITVI